MSPLAANRPTVASKGRQGAEQTDRLLIDTASRGGLEVRREDRWDVYLINGAERPDVREAVTRLIRTGRLHIVDVHADISEISPTKIGVTQ